MRRYMVVGLGLLVGLAATWAGDETTAAPATKPDAQPAQTPPQRLQQAIDLSRELAGKDEAPDTAELKQQAAMMGPVEGFQAGGAVTRFPRGSHVVKYLEIRPWSWQYAPWSVREDSPTAPQDWPTLADAAALRDLLQDKDPAMRAMAAETLATLHQPEDVPGLARLLDDKNDAAPLLGHNISLNALWIRPGGLPVPAADTLTLLRSWRKETVAQSAQRAIRLMTGQQFPDQAAFAAWWKTNDDDRNCLWYWQQRLEREFKEADIATNSLHYPQRRGETWEQYWPRRQALTVAARAEVRKTIAAELGGLSPEVEAKVQLLTVSAYAGGAPITGSEGQFWPDAPSLRLSPDRLLDLLDRKDVWPDVTWDRPSYNRFVESMGMWADVLFRPVHVPRLRSALAREHNNIWWSGQAAMIIGISRLLPPATPDKLDDPDTRDGTLRQAVLSERDLSTRGYCARELVRVGLPTNAAFLTQVSFASSKDDQENRVAQDILHALTDLPRTPQKRQFLVELLLDPRFEPFWTRPNTRMGMDMCRRYGIWAVNAHAGRELIDDSLKNGLVDPARSANALAELRRLVTQLSQPAATQPDTDPAPRPLPRPAPR